MFYFGFFLLIDICEASGQRKVCERDKPRENFQVDECGFKVLAMNYTKLNMHSILNFYNASATHLVSVPYLFCSVVS